jgi:1,2-diacylglycerol 3-beta-glucosyltransferase
MDNILFRKPVSSLTFLVTIIGISLITPLFILGITIGLTIIIPNFNIDSTFLTLFFLVSCTLYNLFLMIMISFGKIQDGDDIAHYFSILVPAKNEEKVIKNTLKHILNLDYPSELFEVIVANDGSIDSTQKIVHNMQRNHSNLKLMNVLSHNGGQGKSKALNTGFADFLITWRGIEIQPRHRWIIGVFDSDAIPDSNMLKKVSFQFNDPKVGGVQSMVRIKNRKTSLLTRMQDIEFITFSRVVQFARTIFKGSVALGGNGQFIRANALDTIALKDKEEYWKKDALTEDLDIGVRLITKKWENRYIDTSATHQEGVENWRAMFNQRERWSWGHLQTLGRYVLSLKLWRANINWKTKIDVMIYLFYILIPFLIFVCWIWSALSWLNIVSVSNLFPMIFTVANGFSFLPLMGYGLWKQRNEYPVWKIIPLLFMAMIFTYHWIPCITSAILKTLLRVKPVWKKTPRFNKEQESLIKEERITQGLKPQIF